jgi:tetratricopeptide (TPR) repeat protein
MNRWVQWRLVVAALLVALSSGCAARVKKRTVSTTPPSAQSRQSGESESTVDPDFETRVKAYANFAAGISADLNDDEAAALDHWLKSAHADPGHELLMLTLGTRLIAARQSDKAITLLSHAANAPDASAAVFNLLGAAYLDSGHTNRAIETYRKAILQAPDDSTAYRNLFLAYRDSRRFPEALAIIDEAAAQRADDPSYWVEIAELYAQYGQLRRDEAEAVKAKAVTALNHAASLIQSPEDGNQMLVLKMADGFRLMSQRTQAEKWYLLLVDRLPPAAGVREKLADIYLRDGEKEKAAEQLQAIAKENPRNEQAFFLLGTIASQEKRFGDAADYLEQAVTLRPDFKPAYYDLAVVKINLNKPDDALQVLAKARRQFGQDFLIESYSGLAYVRLKKYGDAIRNFTEAEIIAKAGEPEKLTHIFYHQFGAALERKGDYGEAEKYFRKSIELSPNFAESLNYLGYMWAERGENLKEARTFIEKAVALEPDNAAFLDSMAWVLFKQGEPREALPWMEKAIARSDEPDATLFDHLGDISAAAGQRAKARDAWRKSLAVEFNEQVSRKLNPAEGNSTPK